MLWRRARTRTAELLVGIWNLLPQITFPTSCCQDRSILRNSCRVVWMGLRVPAWPVRTFPWETLSSFPLQLWNWGGQQPSSHNVEKEALRGKGGRRHIETTGASRQPSLSQFHPRLPSSGKKYSPFPALVLGFRLLLKFSV